jgi:uncharacterized protein
MRILIGIVILFSSAVYAQQPSHSGARPQDIAHSQNGAGCAQPPSAAEVRKMMDVVGTKRIMQTVMATMVQQLFDSFRKMRPDIPPQVWDRAFATLSSDENTQGLLKEIVPIYQRHFCSDEVAQIVAFYESPVGHKLIEEMPAIQQEGFAAGKAYGQRLDKQIKQAVEDELSKKGGALGTPPTAPDTKPKGELELQF